MSGAAQVATAVDALLSQLRVYRDVARVRADVVGALLAVPSLQPRSGQLPAAAASGGSRQQPTLICLAGTIPVVYQGTTYNIPVAIWVPDAYPARPPTPYVTPTSGMIIKPRHRHADAAGMCYLPYLSGWNAGQCNLHGVIQSMQQVFGADPPVRAAPAGHQQQQQQAAAAAAAAAAGAGAAAGAPQPTPPQGRAGAATGGFEDPAQVARRNAMRNLTEKIQHRFAAMPGEIDKMMATNGQLEDKYRQLRTQKDATASAAGGAMDPVELDRRIAEVDKWLATHDGRGSQVSIDVITEPKDALSKQLLQLVAEIAAIEDAIYVLEKALSRDEISCDDFLRQTRRLTQDQFLKMALIKKVQRKQRQQAAGGAAGAAGGAGAAGK